MNTEPGINWAESSVNLDSNTFNFGVIFQSNMPRINHENISFSIHSFLLLPRENEGTLFSLASTYKALFKTMNPPIRALDRL